MIEKSAIKMKIKIERDGIKLLGVLIWTHPHEEFVLGKWGNLNMNWLLDDTKQSVLILLGVIMTLWLYKKLFKI